MFSHVPDAIVDNDGTLVHSMPAHHIAWQGSLAPHNIHFSEPRFYALAGMPAGPIIGILAQEQNVAPAPSVETIEGARKEILAIALKDIKPIKPSLDVLVEARKRGMRIGLASGGNREDVLASLVGAGVLENESIRAVEDVFHAVVTAEDVTRGKPDPETFTLAARRLGVDPSRCVGLEDGDLGLQALQAAGMRAVDVRWHPHYPLSAELKAIMKCRAASTR
jgi:beta-phosphoglucomutase-like phosphatase (HAD superfamily)